MNNFTIFLKESDIKEKYIYILLFLGAVVGIAFPIISANGRDFLGPFVLVFVICFILIIAILRKPTWGIFVLALTTSFSYAFSLGDVSVRSIEIRTDDLILIVTLMVSTVAWIRKKISVRVDTFTMVYIVFLWAGLFSTLINVYVRQLPPRDQIISVFYWVKYSQYFLVFLLTTTIVDSVRGIKLVILAILLGSLITTGWGYYQILSGEFGFIEYDKPRVTMMFDTGPNVMASYYIILLPVVFSLFLVKWKKKYVNGVLLLFLVAAFIILLYTGSRSGLIGFGLSVGVVLFLLDRKKVRKYMSAVIVVGGILLVVYILFFSSNLTYKRLLNFDPETTYISYRVNRIWLPLLKKTVSVNPILGNGIMLFNRIRAENYYIRLFSEQGILGVLIFIILMVGLVWIAQENQRMAHDPVIRGLSRGFSGSIIGILFASFWSDKFIVVRIITPFWILAGLVVASYRLLGAERR